MPKDIHERTFRFSLQLLEIVEKLPKTTVGFELGKQLFRAGTSIGANVIEGDGATSKKEFISYMDIAKKSAKETEYWLLLAEKGKVVDSETVQGLLREVRELKNILGAIVFNARKNSMKT